VDLKVPETIRPYFKLARIYDDIAVWLHAWPAYWSIMLATKPGTVPDFKLIGLFHLIAFFVHVSCCTSNDLFDLDYDRKVERSQTRPLAAGTITPVQGWLFWALNIALLIPLVLQLNKLCIVLAAVQQVLWIVYPFMKRITYWPQAFLGLANNWGATLGWAAVMGNLTDIRIFIPVHIAGIFWTMLYDTIYAHQVYICLFQFLISYFTSSICAYATLNAHTCYFTLKTVSTFKPIYDNFTWILVP